MPYIRTLDLSRRTISNETAMTLLENLSALDLDELILAESKIETIDLIFLRKSIRWKNLKTLNLFCNKIGEKGADYLSNNQIWTNLQALNLSWNNIGDKGAEYLSYNKTWTNLQTQFNREYY